MTEQLLKDMGFEIWKLDDPPGLEPYWFEKCDMNEMRYWTKSQLPNIALLGFVYVVFVFMGPRLMRDRKPFDLQRPLILWNMFLAIFSVAGVYRTIPFLFRLILMNGFYETACVRKGMNETIVFWAFLFAVSKVVELGDTAFLVLRKKPVSFLHW